jgi:hypothetical protein
VARIERPAKNSHYGYPILQLYKADRKRRTSSYSRYSYLRRKKEMKAVASAAEKPSKHW